MRSLPNLVFEIWLVCQFNEEVVEGLHICFRFPDLAVTQSFLLEMFSDLDICQCRQDEGGKLFYFRFNQSALPTPTPIHKTEPISKAPLSLYGFRGSELPG